jgi:hypothetical protein
MLRLALLMKYLPNVKHIQVIHKDLMNILCYLLVLPQTDEKYGKLQIHFTPVLSIFTILNLIEFIATFKQLETITLQHDEIPETEITISKRGELQ